MGKRHWPPQSDHLAFQPAQPTRAALTDRNGAKYINHAVRHAHGTAAEPLRNPPSRIKSWPGRYCHLQASPTSLSLEHLVSPDLAASFSNSGEHGENSSEFQHGAFSANSYGNDFAVSTSNSSAAAAGLQMPPGLAQQASPSRSSRNSNRCSIAAVLYLSESLSFNFVF